MSTLENPLIDRFLDALWLEKGLADNTREAYRNDLQQFNAWLDGRGLRLEGTAATRSSITWPGAWSRATRPARPRASSPACVASIAIACATA